MVEEHAVRFGGPTYKPIVPKTYQILENELAASSGPDASSANAATSEGFQVMLCTTDKSIINLTFEINPFSQFSIYS